MQTSQQKFKDCFLVYHQYFQKDLNLRNEIFAIKDEDITFEKVEYLFKEMQQRRISLFKKAEDFIELGTLQSWAISLATKAVDEFLNCAKNNQYANRIEKENDLFKILNLLSEIQRIIYQTDFNCVSISQATLLDISLLRRENNLFEVILYAESWKINYVINKYFLSLTRCNRYVRQYSSERVNSHMDSFEAHQQEFIDALKSSKKCFHLGHFLPEYFNGDRLKQLDYSFEFESIDAVFKKISETQDPLPEPQEFLMKDLGREINRKGENQKELIRQLVLKKLKRTQNTIEERTYLCLSFYLAFQQGYYGLNFENINLNPSTLPEVMTNSLFTLDFEKTSSIPLIITDVLFHEILQFTFYPVTILFERPQKVEILKSYLDNFLKPSQKIYNPIYLNCMNSFFLSNSKFRELPYCISDFYNQDEFEKSKVQEEQLFQEFQDSILGNILKGDYSLLPLMYIFGEDTRSTQKISEIFTQLFEIQDTTDQLDSVNWMFLQYFRINDSIAKDIIKRKSTDISSLSSQYSSFIDYIHLHFAQNKCPYGSFFVFRMIIEDEKFINNLQFSSENIEKLINILRRVKYLKSTLTQIIAFIFKNPHTNYIDI